MTRIKIVVYDKNKNCCLWQAWKLLFVTRTTIVVCDKQFCDNDNNIVVGATIVMTKASNDDNYDINDTTTMTLMIIISNTDFAVLCNPSVKNQTVMTLLKTQTSLALRTSSSSYIFTKKELYSIV